MSNKPEFIEEASDGCPAVGFQKLTVCVPVKVTPSAHVETTYTKCCGKPVITSGSPSCGGSKNGSCVFTISQSICVAVPVEFSAAASVGDTYVDCLGASDEDCTDCGEES